MVLADLLGANAFHRMGGKLSHETEKARHVRQFGAFDGHPKLPRTKAEILELLRTEGEQFSAWLETLTPEFLAENVTEPDGKSMKTRFEKLLSAKEHEMHHRAQLMLVERQLGIVPHLTRQFQEMVKQMRAAKAGGSAA